MLYGIIVRRDDQEQMDDWDQDKLEDVVKQKHGTEKPNRTTIICKYFLDAVEKKLYGWCGPHILSRACTMPSILRAPYMTM